MPIHGYPGNVITSNAVVPNSGSASGVWTTEQQLQAQNAGNWPQANQILRSLRFNSADSAYLNRTPASAGNRTTWTWSAWVKRGDLSTATRGLFGAGTASSTDTGIYWTSADKIDFFDRSGGSLTGYVSTNAVFRDPSAWYHIVVVFDSGNVTAANRMLIYINNVSQSLTVNNTLPQNTQSAVNNTVAHALGSLTGGSNVGNGYMTEVNFIDGQALTPSSFGQTNAQTGVWEPVAYSGSYGTNGFYLNFSDNSNTTAATLGKDYSGNGNNWTPNNFSVSAGAGNDSLVDTPTPYGVDTGAGGNVRGNYATLNPLNATPSPSISNGNLYQVSTTSGHMNGSSSTIAITSGKWYAEVVFTRIAGSTDSFFVGLADAAWQAERLDAGGWYGRFWYFPTGYCYADNGQKYTNNSGTSYGATYTQGDVIGVAYDADAGTVVFYKNGVSQGTAYTGITGAKTIAASCYKDASITLAFDINFGQRPFAYTAPSGFKALCTQNLPTPTIGATATTRADDYFNTVLYTGTGSSLSVTNVGFQPDFVWIKGRSGATDHALYDVNRGVQKQIESNTNDAQTTETTGLTAFGTDGFTVGALAQLNTNAATYVGWNWKGGGTGVTNTAGSVTGTVSANTTAGFSVVTCSPSGSAFTVGHGLGVAPKMIISKLYETANAPLVYHSSLGSDKYLTLSSTAAEQTSATLWQNTAPTSTVLSFLATSDKALFYCFAEVPGFSRFGSYTGNGSTDGPFIFTGFRPAFVLIKCSSATSDWWLYDTKRGTFNVLNAPLYPNGSFAESPTSALDLDILSNGFKSRSNNGTVNGSGNTYIYAAFAEFPQKFSLAR
jgi:hypothetical protein